MGEAKRRSKVLDSMTVSGDAMSVTIDLVEGSEAMAEGIMIASELREAGKRTMPADMEDGITCPACGLTIVAKVEGSNCSFEYPEVSPCKLKDLDVSPEALKCPVFKPHYYAAIEDLMERMRSRRSRRGMRG